MLRTPALPFLPGNTFNSNIGQTRFHKSQLFVVNNKLPILSEKKKPGIGGVPLGGSNRYPSLYARGEVKDLPPWIAYDKQVLTFEAFFQETLQEVSGSPFQIRKVKIFFFLEDGTVQIQEPKIMNSGISQGCFLSRQRIPFPPPRHDLFYDIIDFNIGKEVMLHGRVFKITDCDRFTRVFLNRCGIMVPDPIVTPSDPYRVAQEETISTWLPRKPKKKHDTLGPFLANDGKVLCFYGYWDDRETEYGIMHDLEFHYFLADGTVEIKEILPKNSGRDSGSMFIKRMRLPKNFSSLPAPGTEAFVTILNVLGPGLQGSRYLADALNCGESKTQYYSETDLAIGAVINVFGRTIVLTDVDPYTKEYYRAKYGIDNFAPLERPLSCPNEDCTKLPPRQLPPWNGIGSFEDSAVNCRTVDLKPPHRDFVKFLNKDKQGLNTFTLRFSARMISKVEENCDRFFIVSYYLCDDTIAVYELARRNSGFVGGQFLSRNAIPLPGQKKYTVDPPKTYTFNDLFVGSRLNFFGYTFQLMDADEYALRYMELHCDEFPKSDINLILHKVREALRPIYKEFVAEHLPRGDPVIPYNALRYALCKNMPQPLTEHEMITIARNFAPACQYDRFTRNEIRAIVLTEIKRNLWNDLERFNEYARQLDPSNKGSITRSDAYNLIRAAKLPLDKDLVNAMLNYVCKTEDCEVVYSDLTNFVDLGYNPLPDVTPVNIKRTLSWLAEKEAKRTENIDWCSFNKAIGLEDTIAPKPPQ